MSRTNRAACLSQSSTFKDKSTWEAQHNWNSWRAEYDKGMRDLLIDLSEASSLTSAGLRTLLALYRLLDDPSSGAGASRPKSSHLKLLNVPPDLQRVFQISGFDFFINHYDDLPTAIASFGAQD